MWEMCVCGCVGVWGRCVGGCVGVWVCVWGVCVCGEKLQIGISWVPAGGARGEVSSLSRNSKVGGGL